MLKTRKEESSSEDEASDDEEEEDPFELVAKGLAQILKMKKNFQRKEYP